MFQYSNSYLIQHIPATSVRTFIVTMIHPIKLSLAIALLSSCLTIVLAITSSAAESAAIGNTAAVWITEGSGKAPLLRGDNLTLKSGNGWRRCKVIVDPASSGQKMIGFGASMTEASAHVIKSSPEADRIMDSLFSREKGIGISLLRLPVGACDFADSLYSYMPKEDSVFSVERDRKVIIPIVKQAIRLNPDLKVIATPWSAPGWMKDNGSMLGVKDYLWDKTPETHKEPDAVLQDKYLHAYTEYIVQYVRAYQAEDIPIYAVTTQNEPYHLTPEYPSMHMPAAQCRDFVKLLGPAFNKADIETRIFVWDHNYKEKDRPGSFYADSIYKDKEASKHVSGSAWHGYSGSASVMGELAKRYPEKDVIFTEQTGECGFEYHHNLKHFLADTFFPAINNGAQTLMAWNTALDEKGGPRLSTVKWKTAQGLITVDGRDHTWRAEAEYAAVGHFSKFVQPGAVKIGTTVKKDSKLLAASFRNPDKSIACVLFNNRLRNITFNLVVGEKSTTLNLKGYSAATIVLQDQ